MSPRMRHPLIVLAIAVGLIAAACTGATTSPTAPAAAPTTASAPASPTAPPTTVATATSAPTTAAATKAPAAATAASTAPAATQAAAATVPAGGVRITLTEGTEARYRAREQLAGQSLPSEAVGATSQVTGSIILGPNGAIVADQSKVIIDLRGLKSDENRRDNYLQRSTLQTSQYPNAEFVPREAKGLPSPLPTSGEATFDLLGDLTIKGVTRPSTWKVTAQFASNQVTGTATTDFVMPDFSITPPRVGPVLSIEETVKLELDFKATRTGAA